MRTRLVMLTGTLVLALWAGGCDDDNPPGPGNTDDAGVSGDPDGGGTDGGVRTEFACNVPRQEGCETGQACHYTDLPDGGGIGSRCFAAECDVVGQDCPDGQRCTYVETGGVSQRRCVEPGTVDEGQPCTLAPTDGGSSYDTCRQGLLCDERQTDGGSGFFCRRLCHASSQCGGGEECNTVRRLPGTAELPLVCGPASPSCDPFAQDCQAPLSCYPSTSGPVCVGSGTLGVGSPCDFSNQCAPGNTCVEAGGAKTCRPLCRTSGEPGCATGTCRPVDDNPGVGACVP